MIINPYAFGVSYDPDAQAFFTASGLTGATNLNAINQLVLDLKSYGIWTKMKAIYPIIGGTAALHKWNLKDPRDLDAAFRLVFNGGYTHTSTGMAGNGTNGYADTFLVPNTTFSVADSIHMSIYSRTDYSSANDLDMGGYNSSQVNGIGALYFGLDFNGQTRGPIHSGSTEIIYGNTDSKAFYIFNRLSNTLKIFRNTITAATLTNTYAVKLDNKIAISGAFSKPAYGNGVDTGLLSSKEYAFASIGDGLTDTEAANLYTAVQNFNTTLGRNI